MTDNVVNLRQARKRRDRAAKAGAAVANRAMRGRTSAEQAETTLEAARRDQLLDGAKRDD